MPPAPLTCGLFKLLARSCPGGNSRFLTGRVLDADGGSTYTKSNPLLPPSPPVSHRGRPTTAPVSRVPLFWWRRAPALTDSLLLSRPEIRRDYPLNLSISLSGGKETNKDSPSNGE